MNVALGKAFIMGVLVCLIEVEFRILSPSFTRVWQESAQTIQDGQLRQRAPDAGHYLELHRAENKLQDKLLFMLVYFRLHPTSEVVDAFFDLSQSLANKWILRLTPLFHETLWRHKSAPKLKPEGLGTALARQPVCRALVNGMDRPAWCPQDTERHKDRYSRFMKHQKVQK